MKFTIFEIKNFWKLKFLALKKFNMRTSHLHNFGINN